MTPREFIGVVALLRWTPNGVATWCGYARQTSSRWTAGTVPIPAHVAAWLNARMAGQLEDPPARPGSGLVQ